MISNRGLLRSKKERLILFLQPSLLMLSLPESTSALVMSSY